MKYCPTCNTRYDEKILRFCMKDGTPLLEEDEPNFTAIPSQDSPAAAEDEGEITVVRGTGPIAAPMDEPAFSPEPARPADRIVVSTEEPVAAPPRPRSRVIPPYQPAPQPNPLKVAALTALGTLAVVAMGAGLVWLFQADSAAPGANNINTNIESLNTNLNTNLGFDTNFNFNGITNVDTNVNVNADLRTPTPSPTPRPTSSPTPALSPSPTPDEDQAPTPTRTPAAAPSPTVRPLQSPTPRAEPPPANRAVPSNRNSG